jgi:ornithine cyclodeaminase/alanine dehydrogenase
MEHKGTLLLNRKDVASLLELGDYIEAVENAFRSYAMGQTLKPELMHVDTPDGEFHIKAGGIKDPRVYFALKIGAGFFQNQRRFGMPNIQGTIALCDGENGYPLAFMDAIEITINRTGAAAAVAAKYLARPDSRVAMICGCGNQGRIQLRCIKEVLPIERAFAYDTEEGRAESYAETMASELGIEVVPVGDLREAVAESDVCVTCTPSREFFLERDWVRPGTFVAAVGADSPGKQEIEPTLLASSTVVADILDQCVHVGDLQHPIGSGLMTRDDVHAELGEVIAGKRPGRTSDQEITVFDSTGTGLQDAVSAAAVYEKAVAAGEYPMFDFFERSG